VQLYLIRHATAEEPHELGRGDADRRLVDEGQTEARLAARALAQMRVAPSSVLTSPLRRCVETARPIAAMLDAPLVEERRLGPGFEPTEFAAVVEAHASARSLVLCGHEPDLSALVGYLTGAHVRMPKGGIARIETSSLRPGGSELRWLLRPKQIRLIAAARVSA
jgi:phosphohistidine phosphatase SixA